MTARSPAEAALPAPRAGVDRAASPVGLVALAILT
jgi:hypothetical protein